MVKSVFLEMAIVILAVSCVFGAIQDEAKIYFPFEGQDAGIDGQCWKNQGVVGFNEGPTQVGQSSETPTVTPYGLKGQAYDASQLTYLGVTNAYMWGTSDPNQSDTEIESVLKNMHSFTVTLWIKADALYDQGRVVMCDQFGINARNDYIQFWLGEAGSWQTSSLSPKAYPKVGHWRFVAVTYDGSDDPNQLRLYSGSENIPVFVDSIVQKDYGTLETTGDYGVPFLIGNGGVEANRPFVGYIDEIRIWSSQTDSSGALNINDLEAIRRYDTSECVGGVMDGDINKDCFVDAADFAIFAQDWLSSNPK